jgi:hypothetical protein
MANDTKTSTGKKATKFKAIAILAPDARYPNGQPFTPVPRFFFRLWQSHSGLPSSFWITLFFLLDTTIGASPEGIEGKIAQSQFPVEGKDAANWIAAISAYRNGCLVEVDYAEYVNKKGSTFRLNPEATEEDWTNFIFMMRLAWLEGRISRNDGNTTESIREFFSKLPKPQPEFWVRLLPIFEQPDEAERETIWDDWIRRGFSVSAWYRHSMESAPFTEEEFADEWLLMRLLLLAWTNSTPNERPLLPDNGALIVEKLSKEDMAVDEESLARVLAKFQKVNDAKGDDWLEYPWLTVEWEVARAMAENKPVEKDSLAHSLAVQKLKAMQKAKASQG